MRRGSPTQRRRPPRGSGPLVAAALSALAWVSLTTSCDADPAIGVPADFGRALPDDGLLLFAFPDALGVGVPVDAIGVEAASLLGEPSGLHRAARVTSTHVNRALREVVRPLIRARDALPARRDAPDRVVWEGAPAEGRDVHRLVVERAADGQFVFGLWSRARDEESARWRPRVFGSTTPSAGARGRGRGAVWADLDEDGVDLTSGKVLALWSDLDGRREVDVSFFAATPDAGRIARRTMRYVFEDRAMGGRLAYGPQLVDIDDDPDRAALEEVTTLSRWSARGAGRTDAAARGGDLRGDQIAVQIRSECWSPPPDFDVVFAATYARRVAQAELTVTHAEGERDACPFPQPEAVIVPPIEDEPEPPSRPAAAP